MNNLFNIETYNPIRDDNMKIKVIPTDLAPLNEKLGGGLMTGEFYIFQAPTGGGKSTLILRMFLKCITSGEKAAYISMGEQTSVELFEKLICMYEGIPYLSYKLGENDYREKKLNIFTKTLEEKINNINIYYTNKPYTPDYDNPNMNDFTRIISDIKKKEISFIFIDYIGADCSSHNEKVSKYELLKLYCDQLEHLAADYNKCIVGAIQMNRNFSFYLRSNDFDPFYVNGEFTADSIGAMQKATVGISFFKHKDRKDEVETQYFNVFKNRAIGDLGPIKTKISKNYFKWSEINEKEIDF